jgi:transposase-like protein
MKKVPKYSPEFRERAVRLVFEQEGEYKTQWATIVAIASTMQSGDVDVN